MEYWNWNLVVAVGEVLSKKPYDLPFIVSGKERKVG